MDCFPPSELVFENLSIDYIDPTIQALQAGFSRQKNGRDKAQQPSGEETRPVGSLASQQDAWMPLNVLGIGVGGGCGVGLGLGWGFGTAFGSHYRSSKLTFQGIQLDKTSDKREDKVVENMSKIT
ncbi:hypothetical protein Rs2_02262 [Raphanus sativus]|nr:hypothetical protein Rs2_02262 [Raphanus sativus]